MDFVSKNHTLAKKEIIEFYWKNHIFFARKLFSECDFGVKKYAKTVSWRRLGSFSARLTASWGLSGRLRVVLELSQVVLGRLEGVLRRIGASWAALGPSLRRLGASVYRFVLSYLIVSKLYTYLFVKQL